MQKTPDDQVKNAVQHAAFLRGTIIGGYAQVEFILGDIWVCCIHRPEYSSSIRQSFPYKLDSRIKTVRALLALPGPLKRFESEMDGLLNQILDYEEIRQFLAHGAMHLFRSDGNFAIE